MVGRAGTAAIAVAATAAVGGGLLYLAWQQGWLSNIGIPKPPPAVAPPAATAQAGVDPRFGIASNEQGYVGHQIGGPNLGAHRGDRTRFAYAPSPPLVADNARQATEVMGSGWTSQQNAAVLRRLYGTPY